MSSDAFEHDHDDEGNCILPQQQVIEHPLYPGGIPTWKWSGWDIVGIAATTAGGLFLTVGQGLNLLARECGAMANWSRSAYDARRAAAEEQEHQEAIARHLRDLVEGPEAQS